jgi:starch synthase (maltosyl-transferring)
MSPPPTAPVAQREAPALPGAIYHAAPADAAALAQAAGRARALGFDTLCLARPLDGMAEAAGAEGLRLLLDADMAASEEAADPSSPPDPRFRHMRRPAATQNAQAWLERWENEMIRQARSGASGFRCILPEWLGAETLRNLVHAVKGAVPGCLLVACIAAPRPELVGAGFDMVAPLLPWVDLLEAGTAGWADGPPLLAMAEPPDTRRLANRWRSHVLAQRALRRAIRLAAFSGAGWLLPAGLELGALHRGSQVRPEEESPRLDLREAVLEANLARGETPVVGHGQRTHLLSAPHAPVALLRQAGGKAGRALVVANPSLTKTRRLAAGQMLGLLPRPGAVAPDLLDAEGRLLLAPAEVRIVPIHDSAPVRLPLPEGTAAASQAATASARIAIENIQPSVDEGRFPVKRSVGQAVTVTADVFTDGHTKIAVRLLWRPADEEGWREVKMTARPNDVWQASFVPDRIGRHVFTVEAWVDVYAAFENEITKKHAAGIDVSLERREGVALLQAAAGRLGADGADLAMVIENEAGATQEQAVALFTLPRTRAAMERGDARPFRTRAEAMPLDVERREAGFAAWYEIFPRSQTNDPNRHGTLQDVIATLPRVRAMGFDVLYFPPIHPIGKKNRKGRNNTLTPGPDDVGSPYAIGSEDGGHDALHPQLGTLEDFRALVAAAAEHGLELALDFAIQCSPDHPWLKDHPDWFDWRPDGSIRYAENPPKKYEDIVNVDFYKPGAIPALWIALRDVVLFWVKEGVKLFRVDNPHTKPLPFWEWMIGEVRARAPEVVFLSEAFTRPKVMYRLAKVGFSQSYTYFTWRNTRAELAEYIQELNEPPVRDFFRPHFFVNTPDINPEFLQHTGRPGHLIRAALAATQSGLWGVYNGFELCEATPVAPGKEEYLDSEKYEIRVWDYDRPGNIVPEITQLNRIRRENPALHTHLGTTIINSQHDGILLFLKQTPEGENAILVAVSMDPRNAVESWIELPQWAMGLPNGSPLHVENLMPGGFGEEVWDGTHRHLRLDPNTGLPFAIWRLRAADKA